MTRCAGAVGGYRAPAWLPGAHLQTIYPAMLAPRATVRYRRERWDAPDGDFIDVDFACAAGPGDAGSARADAQARRAAAPAAADDATPMLVVFHGLEGDSNSHYARALAAAGTAHGWRVAVAHFRGCSGEPNRRPRAYHSGDSDEIDWILRRFAAASPRAPLHAVGVSLGGNALAKWLGERGEDARRVLRAAAAVSPPQDLQAGAIALARGFNRVYTEHFLQTLRRKSLAMAQRYPGLLDVDRVRAARSFFDFDDAVTAPLHGFDGAVDYWTRSSCRRFLAGVRTPLLVLNARNDPFLPADRLAGREAVSADVVLDYPPTGGHVGFLCGRFPGRNWLAGRLLAFLDGRG